MEKENKESRYWKRYRNFFFGLLGTVFLTAAVSDIFIDNRTEYHKSQNKIELEYFNKRNLARKEYKKQLDSLLIEKEFRLDSLDKNYPLRYSN